MAEGCEFLERLEAVAAGCPDRAAVLTAGTDAVTYRDLLAGVDRLAGELARAGAGPERLVGLGVGPSAGFVTGGSGRNWTGYGSRVKLASPLGEAERAVLTDPQTSGGLLVACDPSACDTVLAVFRSVEHRLETTHPLEVEIVGRS